jgi:hypothetical protein
MPIPRRSPTHGGSTLLFPAHARKRLRLSRSGQNRNRKFVPSLAPSNGPVLALSRQHFRCRKFAGCWNERQVFRRTKHLHLVNRSPCVSPLRLVPSKLPARPSRYVPLKRRVSQSRRAPQNFCESLNPHAYRQRRVKRVRRHHLHEIRFAACLPPPISKKVTAVAAS